MDPQVEQDLIDYVTEQKTTIEGNERIKRFCQQQPPVSLVVYRGHNSSTKIRKNNLWYSATTSKDVAKDEFSSGICCVFTIHLINVPLIDINSLIGDKIGHYKEEEEYIFLGGGTFYRDNTLTNEGFSNTSTGEYECWYTLDNNKPIFNLEQVLSLIDPEEYDFIDSPSDIIVEGISEDEKILVFNKIQEIKKMEGGK